MLTPTCSKCNDTGWCPGTDGFDAGFPGGAVEFSALVPCDHVPEGEPEWPDFEPDEAALECEEASERALEVAA
jgi:hypothetical protein